MLTHLGGGAGQGLEDALLLARLLGSRGTNASNVEVRLAPDRCRILVDASTPGRTAYFRRASATSLSAGMGYERSGRTSL